MNANIFIAPIKVCKYKVEILHTIVNKLQMLCHGSYPSLKLRFIPSVFLTMRFNQMRFPTLVQTEVQTHDNVNLTHVLALTEINFFENLIRHSKLQLLRLG